MFVHMSIHMCIHMSVKNVCIHKHKALHMSACMPIHNMSVHTSMPIQTCFSTLSSISASDAAPDGSAAWV